MKLPLIMESQYNLHWKEALEVILSNHLLKAGFPSASDEVAQGLIKWNFEKTPKMDTS